MASEKNAALKFMSCQLSTAGLPATTNTDHDISWPFSFSFFFPASQKCRFKFEHTKCYFMGIRQIIDEGNLQEDSGDLGPGLCAWIKQTLFSNHV